MVMLGTKWPSITSTCTQSAPAWSIARTSSPRRAKSAARMDGATKSGRTTDSSEYPRSRNMRCRRGQRGSRFPASSGIGPQIRPSRLYKAARRSVPTEDLMARTDVLVLGAGIVGTSIALHLGKRGLAVALIDRSGAGEGTSYGNAGIIEGNTIFPQAFPSDLGRLARIALKLAPEANYHTAFLPHVVPWLAAFYAWSQPQRLVETATVMRPFFARAVAEHELLMAESGASSYLRKSGWLKLFRKDRSFAGTARERELAAHFGITTAVLDVDAARALEPSLEPVFRHGLSQ